MSSTYERAIPESSTRGDMPMERADLMSNAADTMRPPSGPGAVLRRLSRRPAERNLLSSARRLETESAG